MGGVAAAEELVLLVDSGDDGVMAWMANTAEATASWSAETAEGKDSVGVALWVVETASALHRGWQRQRRQKHCGWRRAKTALALHHGWQRQRQLCIVGVGDSVDVASWVAEMMLASRRGWRRQHWHYVVGGRDSVSITSWVAEMTSTGSGGNSGEESG